MGLFDFFRKSDKVNERTSDVNPSPGEGKYLGDLAKTAVVRQLCDVPKDKRDHIWQEKFLANIATASFRCANPQVIEGPDGMRYFQLLLPEANKPFQCYVIGHLTNDLLKEGLGVVINADKSDPDRQNKFDLVFNIIPDMFQDKRHFQVIMGSVKWFFPRHYSIICKNEDESFELL